ncbi:MAG: hypothetical protein GXY84_01760 [Clostridiales bacterium]|nr:hypothetical protein [Clostridiales bacterium]
MKLFSTHSSRQMIAVFLLSILLTLPLLPTAQVVEAPLVYINPGEKVPVYESPDEGTKSGFVLDSGAVFEVLSNQGEWLNILRVNEAGQRLPGWVKASGLRPKTQEDGSGIAIVNSADPFVRVHLQKGASSRSDSLGKYYNGVVVTLIQAPKDNYVKVRIGSLEGFMKLDSLLLDAMPGSVQTYVQTATVQNPRDPGLTLRAGQSYQSDKLGGYSNGAQVRVLGVTEEFAQVQTADGQLGFMMASGLSPQPIYADIDPGAYIQQPEGALSVVDNPAGQGAHLRQKGSTSSPSLGLYPNGTQVVVTGGTAWWKQVWVEGRTGYMMATLIRGFVPSEDGGEDDWVMEDWLDSWEGTWVDGESP